MTTSHIHTALGLLETHQIGNRLLKLIWPSLFVYVIILRPEKNLSNLDSIETSISTFHYRDIASYWLYLT